MTLQLPEGRRATRRTATARRAPTPVRAPASATEAFQVVAQRCAHSAWVVEHGTGGQLEDGSGYRLWPVLGNRRGRWPRSDSLVTAPVHQGRSALTAATPRTTSPSRQAR